MQLKFLTGEFNPSVFGIAGLILKDFHGFQVHLCVRWFHLV
jgi:hypothetical protein